MPNIASPTLLIIGLVLLVAGWLMKRWAGKHDLQDVAINSALKVTRERSLEAVKSTEFGQKLGEVIGDGSKSGMARRAAALGAKTVIAQIAGTIGLITMLAGLALAAAGVFWR